MSQSCSKPFNIMNNNQNNIPIQTQVVQIDAETKYGCLYITIKDGYASGWRFQTSFK